MLMSQPQLARRLEVSLRTLERWRVEGGGPPFLKVRRRVRYDDDDLSALRLPALAERQRSLRAWERGFVADLPRFRRLSFKQRYILNEIASRILGAEQGP